jgi:circadian clock protein KaiC
MEPKLPHVSPVRPPLAGSGVTGLDQVLGGGFPRGEMHIVQGVAGTGKTTMALSFLREGVRLGESTLYVTLSQPKSHLERIAISHGWSVEGMVVQELAPGTVAERLSARQSVLATSDVELQEVFQELAATVARVKPLRAVLDSVSIVQILAGHQRYHHELVTLRQLFVENGCTVLFLSDHPAETQQGSQPEVEFHPLAGCVLHLEQEPRMYGDVRRKIRIVKSRGLRSAGGYHDLKIRTGEMEVFPRLGAYTQPEHSEFTVLASGIKALDQSLGGGLEFGTACLLVGPSGVGKSTLASIFVTAAAAKGKHAAIFLFDERPETYKARAEGVKIGLRPHIESGRVMLRQIDPAEIAPGEFAQQVRQTIERQHSAVVVIDSVAGYFNAVGSSDLFIAQLHELLTFLSRRGVLTIITAAQVGFMSIGELRGVDVSYVSDAIMVLGFFEHAGDLRRFAVAVKKRQGGHGSEVRELVISGDGVQIGEPLREFGRIVLHTSGPIAGTSGQ